MNPIVKAFLKITKWPF